MNIKFKEVLSLNCKWIFLLLGIMLGLLFSIVLMRYNQDHKLIELDLKKIIHAYSVKTARSNKPTDLVKKEFQAKFNYAMEQIPIKNIVINKGSLLSKHEVTDYTKGFIEIMEINKINDQKSN